MAEVTKDFRDGEVSSFRVLPGAKGKAILSNVNAPREVPVFDFFGIKQKCLNEPYGPTQWDLSRESIRPVLMALERKRTHETRS